MIWRMDVPIGTFESGAFQKSRPYKKSNPHLVVSEHWHSVDPIDRSSTATDMSNVPDGNSVLIEGSEVELQER